MRSFLNRKADVFVVKTSAFAIFTGVLKFNGCPYLSQVVRAAAYIVAYPRHQLEQEQPLNQLGLLWASKQAAAVAAVKADFEPKGLLKWQ